MTIPPVEGKSAYAPAMVVYLIPSTHRTVLKLYALSVFWPAVAVTLPLAVSGADEERTKPAPEMVCVAEGLVITAAGNDIPEVVDVSVVKSTGAEPEITAFAILPTSLSFEL